MDVQVRNGLLRDGEGVYETDQWIFEQYALFGLINRHVPDCMSDDTVSHALRNVRKTIQLPYDDRGVPTNDGHNPTDF